MHNYYDNWRTDDFDCPSCKWHGTGSALSQGELAGDFFELLCPACGEYVTLVMLPTIEESRANWDKLSDVERKEVEVIENLRANFADRKLSDASQLPEIESPSFTLHWDFVHAGLDSETLIKHGDTIIFREPVIFEGYKRFIEVAKILRARYGAALHDLVPTDGSLIYLYGDVLRSPGIVEKARKRIFSNFFLPPKEVPITETFTVTDSCVDGNRIVVDIEVTERGGLIVNDYSSGPAADACFWEGADVDVELRIPPASVKALGDKLGIYGARALSARWQLIHQGKFDALRLIQRQCAELGVKYSEGHWP